MQPRPAVVVAAVRVGAALEQQPHELHAAGHAEEVVAVRAADMHELGVLVEQLLEPSPITVLERTVGEHERRLRQILDVGDELRPGLEAVPARKFASCRFGVDARRCGDALGTAFVVGDIDPERLLVREVDGGRF